MPSVLDDTTSADEEIIRRVEKIAQTRGWKMLHVALAWHKAKGTVPIVGLNSVQRVEEMGELRDKSLTGEEVKYLEEPYQPKPVVDHT